jgi:hypothetical protein
MFYSIYEYIPSLVLFYILLSVVNDFSISQPLFGISHHFLMQKSTSRLKMILLKVLSNV